MPESEIVSPSSSPPRALPVQVVLLVSGCAGFLAGAIPVQVVLRARTPAPVEAAVAATQAVQPDRVAQADAGDPQAMIEVAVALWQCPPEGRDLPAARAWLERAGEADPRGAQGRRAVRLLGELREFERNLRFDASTAELSE